MNGDLETAVCPLCSDSFGTEIKYRFDPFAVVVCRNCRLHFLSPRYTKDRITQVYKESRYLLNK